MKTSKAKRKSALEHKKQLFGTSLRIDGAL